MKRQLRKFLPILEFIDGLSDKERQKYLRYSSPSLIKFIADLCYNVLLGKLTLKKHILSKLKPHRKQIEKICAEGISLKRRKQIFMKKNFFSVAVSPLIPVLLEIVR